METLRGITQKLLDLTNEHLQNDYEFLRTNRTSKFVELQELTKLTIQALDNCKGEIS
jgi:hypothetical protein